MVTICTHSKSYNLSLPHNLIKIDQKVTTFSKALFLELIKKMPTRLRNLKV